MKLKTELQEKEKELMLQVRCRGEVNCVSMTSGAIETTLELIPRQLCLFKHSYYMIDYITALSEGKSLSDPSHFKVKWPEDACS